MKIAASIAARSALGGLFALLVSGCATLDLETDEQLGEEQSPLTKGAQSAQNLKEGRRLFEEETFGGNGRTCLTCHLSKTGTLSPEDVQDVLAENPQDPLFLLDGSDDGTTGVSRILAHATIRVRRRLPSNVTLLSDPTATSITVFRGIGSTLNTPALDSVLMVDGRAPSLTGQANGAIKGHAQATVSPTQTELELIAEYEQSKRFFTSPELRSYAGGGPAPTLPLGHTPSEKRGRTWFVDAPVTSPLNSQSPHDGLCALCHSGPMLNETNTFLAALPSPLGAPAGARFHSVMVAETNVIGNPVYDLVVAHADGTSSVFQITDPGASFVDGDWSTTSLGYLARFKIPLLRGVRLTAPYFHDNSAPTLADAVEQHALFFAQATSATIDGDPPFVMTAQDKADVVAYLELL